MVSCIEESNFNNVTPAPGKEVQFSANLGTPKTRTLYGAEVNNAVKVNWVNGDVISVYGTDCAIKQSDYAVQANTAATPNGTGQNFADDLVKTGAAGIQWGENSTSDFYAVYPASTGDIVEAGTSVVVPMTIETQQYNSFKVNGNTIQGIPYNVNSNKYGMQNAVMYAHTTASTNDEQVNLRFTPFSTVLKFTIPTWKLVNSEGTELSATNQKLILNSITLTAPYEIAGEFDLTLTGTNAEATYGTSYSITILPSEQIAWTYGNSLEFSVFTIPVDDKLLSEDWTVDVKVSTANEVVIKSFSLAPTVTEAEGTDGKKYNPAALTIGQIHEIQLAKGFAVESVWTYDEATWISTIPRNVYIADLSLPGAWYCTNGDYQKTTNLATQYSKGIRAFNIDCRLTYKSGSSGEMDLYCAGTEKSSAGRITNEGTTVLSALKQISEQISESEYVVAVLTIAEKKKTDSGNTLGTVNPSEVLEAIKTLLTNNGKTLKVYGYTEETLGNTVDANTTVNDVLNHMIIKVNINTMAEETTLGEGDDAVKITGFTNYNNLPNTLLSYASMAPSREGEIVKGVFDEMQTSPMYWGEETASLTYYYHQAQRTLSEATVEDVEGVPYFTERINAIDDIIDRSHQIYSTNKHNAWFQLGIGGYRMNRVEKWLFVTYVDDETENHEVVAQTLNPYVYAKIVTKEKDDIAPVGIVLMNFCTDETDNTISFNGNSYTASSIDLVNAIIDLNGKYYLNRDVTQEPWPTDGGGTNEDGM